MRPLGLPQRALAKGVTRPLGNQKRQFIFAPDLPSALSINVAQVFNGRGFKKRCMTDGTYDRENLVSNVRIFGGHEAAPKRLPDIDDPRPPIVGWSVADGDMDFDGTLPFVPFELPVSEARKIIQGRYCDFKEIWWYNQPRWSLYGGGGWMGGMQYEVWQHTSSITCGMTATAHRVWMHSYVTLRADLSLIYFSIYNIIFDGLVATTDGHPRNTNKPGRVSKINEGEMMSGLHCFFGPQTHLDACWVGSFCEIGASARLGNGAFMERYCSVEPGSVVMANQRIPRYEVWGGNPAKKQGYRAKDINMWVERMWSWSLVVGNHYVSEHSGMYPGHSNQMLMGTYRPFSMATKQSIGEVEDLIHQKLKQNYGKMPEKAKEYIGRFTADIPLWELYKNMSRGNFRPGVRREFGWTVDPKRCRWVDHF